MTIHALTSAGEIRVLPVTDISSGNCRTIRIPKDADFTDIRKVILDPYGEVASQGDEGYFVIPRGSGSPDYGLFFFDRTEEDFVKESRESDMPIFGVHTKELTFLAVVAGMSYDYTLTVSRENGRYRIYPVIDLFGEAPEEDIVVQYCFLTGEDADYSGMARRYRQIQIERYGLRPLRERTKEFPALKYAADSVMIRIRCAWKPAPPEILHQTLENEPPVHVACDFDRVGELLDELKKQGVEKAEICLVGWNVKGHDGRWPQIFPVCEEAGGEKKLRELIKKAQAMGYQITCHTNHTDQYEIADCFSENNIRVGRDGKKVYNREPWSGGEMSHLCPQIGARQAKEFLPAVAELGFFGLHYVDVLGVVHPRRCFHPDHYVTSRQSVGYAREIAETSRTLFGGFSSEGTYDFISPYLDYGLYTSFADKTGGLNHKSIPFWQIVYHGYVLANPYPSTVNCTLKGKKAVLRLMEYGGRPSFYVHSKFYGGNAWMGEEDLRVTTDEELAETAARIREGDDIRRAMDAVKYAAIRHHREIAPQVYEILYDNGTHVIINYNSESCEILI